MDSMDSSGGGHWCGGVESHLLFLSQNEWNLVLLDIVTKIGSLLSLLSSPPRLLSRFSQWTHRMNSSSFIHKNGETNQKKGRDDEKMMIMMRGEGMAWKGGSRMAGREWVLSLRIIMATNEWMDGWMDGRSTLLFFSSSSSSSLFSSI